MSEGVVDSLWEDYLCNDSHDRTSGKLLYSFSDHDYKTGRGGLLVRPRPRARRVPGIYHELMRGTRCAFAPLLSVCLIESGFLGCVVSEINLTYFACGKSSRWMEKCKLYFKVCFFINNVLGK
ncbi:hypothetical protein AVEN_102597-1 [Araneus ventricosus]|uniref:Uncharacterized protein n=1 Tax=Araneus ventricosus TaxID=182803 RepID=A0A4Y2BKY6_ARAVE|nr:hypothetical protein AVEN_102597-1 [Araneus ventricosus]